MTAEPPSASIPDAGAFRIDRDGVWRHEDQEVTHPGVLANLYANLRAEGLEHYLQVGPRRIPVRVEDTPFVVTRLEPQGLADPTAYLSDGSREAIDPAGLWLGPRGTPYCLVKAGRFRARLSLAAWLQLAPLLSEAGTPGQVTLTLGSRRIVLGGVSEDPPDSGVAAPGGRPSACGPPLGGARTDREA
jgi:hypothetical protein